MCSTTTLKRDVIDVSLSLATVTSASVLDQSFAHQMNRPSIASGS